MEALRKRVDLIPLPVRPRVVATEMGMLLDPTFLRV